jgi:hypothetical protein
MKATCAGNACGAVLNRAKPAEIPLREKHSECFSKRFFSGWTVATVPQALGLRRHIETFFVRLLLM